MISTITEKNPNPMEKFLGEEISYSIIKNRKNMSDLGTFDYYGVEISKGNIDDSLCIKYVFETKSDILNLFNLLVKNEVSYLHLYDTVYDHICDRYSVFD